KRDIDFIIKFFRNCIIIFAVIIFLIDTVYNYFRSFVKEIPDISSFELNYGDIGIRRSLVPITNVFIFFIILSNILVPSFRHYEEFIAEKVGINLVKRSYAKFNYEKIRDDITKYLNENPDLSDKNDMEFLPPELEILKSHLSGFLGPFSDIKTRSQIAKPLQHGFYFVILTALFFYLFIPIVIFAFKGEHEIFSERLKHLINAVISFVISYCIYYLLEEFYYLRTDKLVTQSAIFLITFQFIQNILNSKKLKNIKSRKKNM
ncbi:hypothetical protein ACFL4T_13665, partial [candidate division KSB1 bacterium]